MGFTWVGFSLACKYQSRVEVTNTLAYYSTELNTEVQIFMIQGSHLPAKPFQATLVE
jgi:hypothetical protein